MSKMSVRKNGFRFNPYPLSSRPKSQNQTPQTSQTSQQTQEEVLAFQAADNSNLAIIMAITQEQYKLLCATYNPVVHYELAKIIDEESKCFREDLHLICPIQKEFVGMYSTLASANSNIPDVPPPTDLKAPFFPNGYQESYEFFADDFKLEWSKNDC